MRRAIAAANVIVNEHSQTFVIVTQEGIGAGSTPKDFEALGLDVKDRFKLLREGLPVIRKLINGQTVGVANHHPAPNVVGKPPIILAAWHSGPWIERAAKEYDGWIASGFAGFATLREGIKRYKDAGGTGRCTGTRGRTSRMTSR